jgi:hypothetical protein
MFEFKLEPDLRLLVVTRFGFWSLETVKSYEIALRSELAKLHLCGGPTSFIIDIRAGGPQPEVVANALRAMVKGLGPLHAHRTAVVTSSGMAKLQARRVADPSAQVFSSMVLARDWVLSETDTPAASPAVHDEPSSAEATGLAVHVHGPSDVDVTLTPAAALETAKRIGAAAIEVMSETATGAGAPVRAAL